MTPEWIRVHIQLTNYKIGFLLHKLKVFYKESILQKVFRQQRNRSGVQFYLSIYLYTYKSLIILIVWLIEAVRTFENSRA